MKIYQEKTETPVKPVAQLRLLRRSGGVALCAVNPDNGDWAADILVVREGKIERCDGVEECIKMDDLSCGELQFDEDERVIIE